MSSTDDLSSRPHSPSMSSSDESYSKTTENEEGTDSPLPPQHTTNQMLRITNPLQWLYPGDIQVDPTISPKLSPMELAHLKEFEISSTTESHAPSTVPGDRTKGESCNSFEYLNDQHRYPKSPFEREIQRLLETSNKAAIKEVVTNGNKTSGSSSGGSVKETSDNNQQEKIQKINNQSILMCGLDAIREIARKNPSDSSQMQTSDTESCEIINDLRRKNEQQQKSPNDPSYFITRQQQQPVSKSFIVRKESLKSAEGNADTDDNELLEDEIHQNYISDALKYGAGHQSMDSNPLESQSEWSDEELREEATGKIIFLSFFFELFTKNCVLRWC